MVSEKRSEEAGQGRMWPPVKQLRPTWVPRKQEGGPRVHLAGHFWRRPGKEGLPYKGQAPTEQVTLSRAPTALTIPGFRFSFPKKLIPASGFFVFAALCLDCSSPTNSFSFLRWISGSPPQVPRVSLFCCCSSLPITLHCFCFMTQFIYSLVFLLY